MDSSQIRDRTCARYISKRILCHCATREVLYFFLSAALSLCCGTQSSLVAAHCLIAPQLMGSEVPQPGMELESPALEGRFVTTRLPGKSQRETSYSELLFTEQRVQEQLVIEKVTLAISHSLSFPEPVLSSSGSALPCTPIFCIAPSCLPPSYLASNCATSLN